MPSNLEDIPAFLRIPQDERKAAWDKARVAVKQLPPEPKLPPIQSPPGVASRDTDS
jgi:hypothetical protein